MLVYTPYTWILVAVAGLLIFFILTLGRLRRHDWPLLFGALTTAYVLSQLIWLTGPLDFLSGLQLTAGCWLAFQVPLFLNRRLAPPLRPRQLVTSAIRQLLALSAAAAFLSVFF